MPRAPTHTTIRLQLYGATENFAVIRRPSHVRGSGQRLADTPPLNGARVSRPMGSPDGNWVIERVTSGSGTSFLHSTVEPVS